MCIWGGLCLLGPVSKINGSAGVWQLESQLALSANAVSNFLYNCPYNSQEGLISEERCLFELDQAISGSVGVGQLEY